jgi:hypothetical protein
MLFDSSRAARRKLSPSVFLEKRKSLGTEHIYGIIHAIQNLSLEFTHRKHWEDCSTQREVNPLPSKNRNKGGIWLLWIKRTTQ